MELKKPLEKAGLTEAEAKIYKALLKLGLTTTGSIIKETRLQSSTVYHCLDSLIDKGVISFIIKNNVKHYRSEKIDVLMDFIDEQKKELEKTKKILSKDIQKILSEKEERGREIKIFEGWKGLWTAFSECLDSMEKGGKIYIFTLSTYAGADPKMARLLISKIRKKRLERKLYEKVIINKAEEKTLGKDHEKVKHTEVKYLPQNLAHPTIIHIYKKRVLIVVSTKKPVGILIKDEITQESFKNYFKLLWEIAEPSS